MCWGCPGAAHTPPARRRQPSGVHAIRAPPACHPRTDGSRPGCMPPAGHHWFPRDIPAVCLPRRRACCCSRCSWLPFLRGTPPPCVGRRARTGMALTRVPVVPGRAPANTSLASARPRGSSVRRAYCTATVLGLALGTVTVRMSLSWEAFTSPSMLSSPASSAGSATAWTFPRSRRLT